MRMPKGVLGAVGILAAMALLGVPLPTKAQSVAQVVDAIDHARIATRVLYVTAHPDDERESVLTYLSKGLGDDVALCSTTRGEGGQNAIGPELGPALKVLRTSELYRATRVYGVHLFFTRAPDFGYSKSAEEVLRVWHGIGKEDLTRVIRTFRPNIVINQWGGVHSGHGAHQATGIITPQAVEAAADINAYPDQLKEGLRPWQVSWVLQYARGDQAHQPGVIELPVNEISSLWGESYAALGLPGFANHRSQGVTRFLGSRFFDRPVYLKVVQGGEFTPQDLAESLFSLSQGSAGLAISLGAADGALTGARQAALRLDWPAAVKFLATAGSQISKAISQANSSSQTAPDAGWELHREEKKIDKALGEAMALHLAAESDRGALVAGESFTVRVSWDVRPGIRPDFAPPSLELPAGWKATIEKPVSTEGSASEITFRVTIPSGATQPASPQDAIRPWPLPLVTAKLPGTIDGYTYTASEPAVWKDYTSTAIETSRLALVPAVTLSVDPQQIMLPENRRSKTFQLLARVRYHGEKAAQVGIGLEAPAGWNTQPLAPLSFTGPGDRLVRFVVTPPADAARGAYPLQPFAAFGDEKFETSYESLPSRPSLHVSEHVLATAHVLDLAFPPHLRIGYIAAGIDPVPQTLEQLGLHVDLLDEPALAFGDLSQYNAIVVGIRAYELRPDVMEANGRLLEYVRNGGTLLVEYERDFAWNKLLPAPFPARMDQPAERITNENSPVRFADPSSRLLNYPNHITQKDFLDWIQERGIYFWGKWDPRYHAVLAMHDPGEPDALGGLVYARDGKGIYIYTGLDFFRQLPAGVPGAYRLFLNLLSASQAPGAAK